MIKPAANAASPKTKSRNPEDQAPGERPVPRRPQAELPSGAPLELGPMDLVSKEAALASDLIEDARSLPGRLR